MSPTEQATQVLAWRGHSLVDSDGSKIGKISDIYMDDQTGQPEWLAVSTGLFGTRVSFVPIAGATAHGNELAVPYSKQQVKDAPHAEPDGYLTLEEEARLYSHYGMAYSESPGDRARGTDPGRDTGDLAMTRSEEELRVGTVSQEAGRVRLRKWIESETVSTTVPVSHDEVRIERQPVNDANRDVALSGAAISEETYEMTLYEDKVDVDKVVVSKERVRVDKDVVSAQRQVTEEVHKEHIDVDQIDTERKTR